MSSSASNQVPKEADVGGARGLAGCIKATELMLDAARKGEWGRVTVLESARSHQLSICFSEPIKPEHAQVSAEAIAVMLHMNEELVALLESAKAEVAAATKGQTATGKNLQHYLAVESSNS